MIKRYFLSLVLAVVILMSAAGPAQAYTNLFNYAGGEYPSFKWTWTTVDGHSIEEWNDGSTEENFFDTRFVFNIVRLSDGTTELDWDVVNKYFTDGTDTVYITNYNGEFDNTDGLIPNMKLGIWPYYDFGTLWANGEHVTRNFEVTGSSWSRLEGDTIAHIEAVPEPSSWLLLGTGLIGLYEINRKKKKSKKVI